MSAEQTDDDDLEQTPEAEEPASAEDKQTNRAPAPSRPFPRRTLEQALRVPRAIRDHNGGQPWAASEVAAALGVGAKTGNAFYLTSAAKQYGLTEGTNRSAEISLTDLGRQAVYPASQEDEQSALREAFLTVDLFRRVLEHYGGNNLPEKRYRENTLFTKFELDPSVQDEFVELLTKNSKLVGIGDTLEVQAGSGASNGRAPGLVLPASPDTQTVATPALSSGSAPVCFVIMPFVERDDRHSTGFFNEVLAAVFTPAITGAGLEVRTAKRQGSDVIQSTIVKELLAADLVLADLTEHNPNVLFELGVRMASERPVVLVRARGTGAIFDVDNMLRVEEYSPNLWPTTVQHDVPRLQAHIEAAWNNRDSVDTYMRLLRSGSEPTVPVR
jgi:hypothetical protein